MFLLAWFACTPGTSPPFDPPAPPDLVSGWFAGAELLSPLQECAVVALDGRVVVVGGFDDALQMVDRVEAYDPGTDTWSSLPSLPRPLHHANVAVLDGVIHVAGALADSFQEIGDHWALDEAAGVWEARAPLADEVAVGAAGVGVIDGRLHLVGGLRLSRTVASHVVYDPVDDDWENLPDAPTARDHLAAGVVDGRLIVTGGRDGGIDAHLATTEVWDPVDGWSVGAPLPTARGGVAAAVSPDGLLHVLGGEGNAALASGVFDEHEAYDLIADRWTELDPMETPRHGTGAVFVDGVLWIPGGAQVQAFGADDTQEGWIP